MAIPRLHPGAWLLLLTATLAPHAHAHTNGADTLLAGLCRPSKEGPLLPHPDALTCPLPVDDETAFVSGHRPWSYHPTCAHPMRPHDPKYCLYTYSSFRGAGAISIITTPEIASEAVGLLHDPNPQWNKWTPALDDTGEEPYVVRDVPGKGKGAFATRPIKKGEVVISEPASIIGMMSAPRSILGAHRKILAERAYEQLDEEKRQEVAALVGREEDPSVEDIMNTNAFTIVLAGVDKHRGLFPRIARINHDCRPSVFPRFSRRRLTMDAVAYRDIEPGEELSVSYAPVNIPTADRQRLLLQNWGFNCTCTLCTTPTLSQTSDRNRARIQALLSELDEPSSWNAEILDRIRDEMLGLIATEGMEMLVGDFYGLLARMYQKAGLPEKGVEYAVLAVEKLGEYIGEDSEQVARAGIFLRKAFEEAKEARKAGEEMAG